MAVPKFKLGALVYLKSNPEIHMVICGYITKGRKNYYYLGKVNCRWLDRN